MKTRILKTRLIIVSMGGFIGSSIFAAAPFEPTPFNPEERAPLCANSLVEQLNASQPFSPSPGASRGAQDKSQRLKEKEEQLYRAYRRLEEGSPQLSVDQRRGAISALLTNAAENRQSPLLPYIYYLAYTLGEEYSPHFTAVENYFSKTAPKQASCPYFYFMNDQVTGSKDFFAHPARVSTYIGELRSLSNKSLQFRLILNFLAIVSREHQLAYHSQLAWIGRSYPALRERFSWLEEAAIAQGPSSPSGLPAVVQQANRTGGCDAGKKKLIASLSQPKAAHNIIEQFMAAAEKIDGCVRPQGSAARLSFWRSLKKPVAKAYGFSGWGTVQLKIARLLWNDEKNARAKKVCSRVLALSGKKRDREIAGRAAYLYSAILQNEHAVRPAIKHFEEFLRRFPRHSLANDARQALLFLYAGQKLWSQVYTLTTESIAGLRNRSIFFDKNTASTFYFWQARAAQKLGNIEDAQHSWQILADTYFGTYYGALGHYLLESSLHHVIPLQPQRQIPVDRTILETAFNPISRERQKISLVLELLEMGKMEDASCEISMMSFEGQSPDQQLARSLLLHISGEWLEAVKIYQRLPEDYRQSLPIGFEKIFFPKKYEHEIEEYAEKVNIDPDFVYSLIRQESVFNPMAQSPVGAKGLMQMMNETALAESLRLSATYLTEPLREEILRKSKIPATLFEPKTNLILGVHHLKTLQGQFSNPILILAAYNAGPGAATKWQNRLLHDDMLVFIENIPYQETRNYVKLILRNYFYYKRLYPSPQETYPLLSFLNATS